MWQMDCDTFRRTLRPFELRDVDAEHMEFVAAFALEFELNCVQHGSIVRFEPQP